ncbi:hypothetical protein IV454_09520 [Massilia antarctica]|uniref:DUF2986 domain-containing protein n=1 Tax=Massilia antarctica TaxID=2765360 RepID=A0AA49AAA6_9BURK|nr:hypothetical protein [Massilia antarctica]QPI51707.1 hypothetical protein IV454_09520 [Massilia antarctica]
MANKALATRQKMRITVKPTQQVAKVRNPVAVAAKLRAAGPHAKGPAQERQAVKRALKKAKLEPEPD